jgi:hypothetical protein
VHQAAGESHPSTSRLLNQEDDSDLSPLLLMILLTPKVLASSYLQVLLTILPRSYGWKYPITSGQQKGQMFLDCVGVSGGGPIFRECGASWQPTIPNCIFEPKLFRHWRSQLDMMVLTIFVQISFRQIPL